MSAAETPSLCAYRGCTRWGFEWGPMQVSRVCHIEQRGYVIDIRTPHASLEIYVTEKGRKIEARSAV
jgi:hypothetical protein